MFSTAKCLFTTLKRDFTLLNKPTQEDSFVNH